MAERRMFSQAIVDSDNFLDMPLTTQSLYFHLGMRADDYGFINNPKKILRIIGANEDELKILIAKKFIISFESGVVVIKHWLLHNNLRQDRIKSTNYTEELKQLIVKENKSYTINDALVMETAPTCQPTVNQPAPTCQHSIEEVRLGEVRLGEVKVPTKSYDDSFRLAEYLLNNILRINPNHKIPNLNLWAKDIDLAIRIDGRTVNQLKECIDWIHKTNEGVFWRKNILSGSALRAKFDTMNMQVITKKPTQQEKRLSDTAQLIYNQMKKRGHSEDEIRAELEKVS